jgi:hypothetical protein
VELESSFDLMSYVVAAVGSWLIAGRYFATLEVIVTLVLVEDRRWFLMAAEQCSKEVLHEVPSNDGLGIPHSGFVAN